MTINIGWEYFLGIMGGLTLIAWYSGSRFSTIEANIKSIFESIKRLDNRIDKGYSSASPIRLSTKGESILNESGLQEFVDVHKDDLISQCDKTKMTNPYDIQESAFKFFDELKIPELEDKMKTAAFNHGVDLNTVRRIGGIYFRDACLRAHNYKPEDLDNSIINN